jgi:FSR family fosmidomycin resistance protein-like MFS transporter
VGLKLMPVAAILSGAHPRAFHIGTMPSISHESGDAMTPQKGLFSTMKSVFAVIYPIWAMSTVRDAASQGVRMFFPIRIAAEGGDIAFVGTVLFLIMLGSTIAMLVIGKMADRYGKKQTLTVTMALSSLFLFAGRASGDGPPFSSSFLGTAA